MFFLFLFCHVGQCNEADVLIVDPPRKGLDQGVIDLLLNKHSSAAAPGKKKKRKKSKEKKRKEKKRKEKKRKEKQSKYKQR